MKTFLLSLFLFPIIVIAQSKFLNFDFEDVDSTGKNLLKIEYKCNKTILEINRNNEIVYSGNNCLSIFANNNDLTEGCTIYTSLPKEYCKNLRHIKITLKSRYQFEYKNGGVWVFATKGNKYLGKASTYPGYFPWPIIHTYKWKPMNMPVIPYQWDINTLEFNINEDPDELLLGFYVKNGRIWFDDIQITLNDKPINDLVFQIEK